MKGTGLGLSLSKRLAELPASQISLQSEIGVGSTFTLTIPACARGVTEHARALREYRLAGTRVIDDDEIARYLLGSLLDGDWVHDARRQRR